MNMKKLLALILAAALVLTLAACGKKEENTPGPAASGDSAASGPLTFTWDMESATWSSPNGATIRISAVPSAYDKNNTVAFVAQLEGEDIATAQCQWDGNAYTASLDLNGADGYCYFLVVNAGLVGEQMIEVNTPNSVYNENLINLAASLSSHCTIVITDFDYADGKLTVTDGTATVQMPRISNAGERIVCKEANLILSVDDEDITGQILTLPEMDDDGLYTISLNGLSFTLPDMEDDHRISIRLEAQLSNGQHVSDHNGINWFFTGGNLQLTVG